MIKNLFKVLTTIILIFASIKLIATVFIKVSAQLKPKYLLAHTKVDASRVKAKAQNTSLMYLRPSFSYVNQYVLGKTAFDAPRFEKAIRYYEQMIQYYPTTADAFGMLGFCYFQKGNISKTIDFYRRAVYLAPKNFWYVYNLASIYFKQEKYVLARQGFEQALTLDVSASTQHIKNSSVFSQYYTNFSEDALKQNLYGGFIYAHIKVILAFFHEKKYPEMFSASKRLLETKLKGKDIGHCYAGIATFQSQEYLQSTKSLEDCLNKAGNYKEAYDYALRVLEILQINEASQIKLREWKQKSDQYPSLLTFGQDPKMILY